MNNKKISDYKSNKYSQFGEDGIIQAIFDEGIIPKQNIDKWCCEFGAWDGELYSNTCNLVKNHEYNGIFIEANPERYKQLLENYGNYKNQCYFLNEFVDNDQNSLDKIFLRNNDIKNKLPKDFDLLSIDIDGNDYNVWEAFLKSDYRPKIVVIEYNQSIPDDYEFVQQKDDQCLGSSICSFDKLALEHDYYLVAVTDTNLIFIDYKFYLNAYDYEDNFTNKHLQTNIIQSWNGYLYIIGNKKLFWQGKELTDDVFKDLVLNNKVRII